MTRSAVRSWQRPVGNPLAWNRNRMNTAPRFRFEAARSDARDADFELRQMLGPLAATWLSDEALELARQDGWPLRADDPSAPGDARILCVNNDPSTYRLLQPGLVLPVRWTATADEHDRRLPSKLCDVAELARTVGETLLPKLPASQASASERPFLSFPSPELAWPDLNDLNRPNGTEPAPLEFDSAFGALLLGYVSLRVGLLPRKDVLVSVAWRGRVQEVTGLDVKLALAHRLDASELHVLRPPDDDRIWRKIRDEPRSALAFQGLFNTLLYAAPELWDPNRLATDETLLQEALRTQQWVQTYDRGKADELYDRYLRLPVADRCRNEFESSGAHRRCDGRHLVTFATGSHQLTRLALRVLRPRSATILVNDGLRQREDLADRLPECRTAGGSGDGVETEFRSLPGDVDAMDRMASALRRCLQTLRESGRPLMFELTGGTTWMKLMLAREIRADEPALICESNYPRGSSIPEPGTQRFRVLPSLAPSDATVGDGVDPSRETRPE